MTGDETGALATYAAACTDHAQLRARWEELCGPIEPLTDGPVPTYTDEQLAAWEAANAAEQQLITAFYELAKARGIDL